MRKSKKQLLRTLMACGLVVSVAAGGTVAYLTDAETATNTFTVGKVKIDLEEPGYPGNNSDDVKNIIPNQEIVKDPQIENTGNNDALVFLRVEVPQETFTELDADNNVGEKNLQDLFKLKNVSDQWELLRTETATGADGKTKTSYVYGYKKTLTKGSTTDKLFQKVQMKNSIEKDLEGNVEDVIVTACAIQATDIPDINLTPDSDGNLSKDVLDQVYTIFMNQSGNQTSRPADEGDRNQLGKLGKISYKLDGGTLAAGSLTEYGSADYGYMPPEPTKEGYTFTGWSPASIPADSAGNVIFTANWEARTTAALVDGQTLNEKMKTLAGDNNVTYKTKNTTITSIQRSGSAPSASVIADTDSLISADNSENPVYMWFEDGTIMWWTQANTIEPNSDLSYLCYNLQSLTDISGLANWDVENTTNLSDMFNSCSSLTDLTPLKSWNVSNVTDMTRTFAYCSTLTDLIPLKNWDTRNVTSMRAMFSTVSNLVDLNPLAQWNTAKVENMAAMFASCTKLTTLSVLKSWDTGNATDIDNMFRSCIALNDLSALADWDVSNVTNMNALFYYCTSLTDVSALKNWNVENVTDMSEMFYSCKLTDLTGLEAWNTGSVTTMAQMFWGTNIVSLTALENWNTENVESMYEMFSYCGKLADLTALASWNTGNVTNMSGMFSYCSKLTTASAINDWNIAKVTNFRSMFGNVRTLEGTDVHPNFTRRSGTWNNGTFTPRS